jgi:hypothetical protein
MKRKPYLSTARAAEIYNTVVGCRRIFCEDSEFFKATELWGDLCSENNAWRIRKFRSVDEDSYKLKAGVIVFEDLGRVTLTVSEELWAKARDGGWMQNFVLAHELGHIALGHHDKGLVTKNFQVFAGPKGLANTPPTLEEEEANYAAVFLQCGVALEDQRWQTLDLARRAFSDPSYVRKAQAAVRLDVFQQQLKLIRSKHSRVVL